MVQHRTPRGKGRGGEKLLHGPDVIAVLQEMGRERMPEQVGRGVPHNPRPPRRSPDGLLYVPLMDVMAALFLGAWVKPTSPGRKEELPAQFARSALVLPVERVRQNDASPPFGQVFLVEFPHALKMPRHTVLQALGQHCQPILPALAIAYDYLVCSEVYLVRHALCKSLLSLATTSRPGIEALRPEADREGLSCWRLDRVEREIPFDVAALKRARDGLLAKDLVAFRPWGPKSIDGSYQMLSAPKGNVAGPRTGGAASLGEALSESLGRRR